jgi:hypothetical protein
VRAYKPLEEGEEIFISYFDTEVPRAERQKMARDLCGFTCECAVCNLPLESSNALDAGFKLFQEAEAFLDGRANGSLRNVSKL